MELIFSAGIIFSLRLADQSLGTMRSLLVAKNKPIYAALIGLVESAIWIVAISQVIKDIDDPFLIGAYASGFAAGTILGSYIERLVGLGNIVVRVFSPADSPSVAEKLRENGHGVTVIDGQGKDGPIKIYWCVISRRRLRSVLKMIEEINPKAYITTDMTSPTSLRK
ncbi:MAG: DUF2179 domain-containing protein [Flavobacteriales bacterium]|jgi:uncharacterized protein YebE (UPF0316 family)|nr:DUF2179 domain-containing protein [Flavobacteriales bacterium]MBU46384.1 DUF2179 domain-containing protein [Flavobacteriales bacterium]|tara:strand:- start:27236 stop:27736 length:501 start_codon:yes stop_codon:yes gene_type:complete